MELEYKKYSPEYKTRVIELLGYLWNFSYADREAYFKWKFEDNPYTDSVMGFMALDGDKVVAFRGYMVIPVAYRTRRYLNAVLADTVTHPDYRRRGIFQAITNYSILEIEKDERYLVSLNSSSGGPTLGGYLKLGWFALCEREHLFRFTVRGIWRKLHKTGCEISLERTKNNLTYILTGENRPADIVTLKYEYDYLSHERTEEFYSWRFRNPHNRFLFAYLYDKCGELSAYVIFAVNGGRFDIVDFNCKEDKSLKLLLNWVGKEAHPFYISLWTVGKNNCIYRNRRAFGFLSLSFILNKFKKFRKPPFLAREFAKYESTAVHDIVYWDLYKLVADEI